jgi:hypothetical protein
MLIFVLIFIGGYYLYKFATKNHDYFEKPNQRLKYVRPLPFVGSNFSAFFKKKPALKLLEDNYKLYKNEK